MANWWSLKVISGPEAGKIYLLKPDRTVIGRVKGDIVLRQDLELSSVHAEIQHDTSKGVLVLSDLQSRNGCRVNGEKVEKRALIPGDKLKFGTTELVLEPPSAEATIVSRANDPDATRVADPASKAAPAPQQQQQAPAAKSAESGAPAPADAAKSAEGGAEKKKDSGKKEESMYMPSRSSEEFSSGPEFHSFFGRFFGILLHPTQFFDFLASENALISGDQALKAAIQFGAINWIVGGVISTVLSYYSLFVWKISTGPDLGANPFALGIGTIVGIILLPPAALLYHWICLALGGKGPFKVALRVVCYLSAVHFLKDCAILIPKAGPFIALGLTCYMLYLLSLAATRLYWVTPGAAYVASGVSVAATVAIAITTQHSAVRLQDQIATLNPLLNKSMGVSFVPANTPGTTTTTTTTAPIPVPAPAPVAQTPSADPQPPSTASTDPQPPSTPPVDQQQRDPAATATPPANTDTGGDPEPPQLPKTVE